MRENKRMEDLAKRYEREAASVAVHQRRQFQDRYRPLLLRERDRLLSQESPAGVFRGRANADLARQFQAADTGLAGLRAPAAQYARASAMSEQAGKARAAAQGQWNEQAANVVAGGRNQAMQGASGLASAARITGSAAASTAMSRLQLKQAKERAMIAVGKAAFQSLSGNYLAGGTPQPSTGSPFNFQSFGRPGGGLLTAFDQLVLGGS